MTTPDGTVYKEVYGGTGDSPAWKHGLVTSAQVLTGSTVQKTITIAYTQDNTGVDYQSNPRKGMNYGDGHALTTAYDNRLRPTTWNVSGVLGYNYRYNNRYLQ